MKLLKLKNIIAEVLPHWHVSIDEAEMINIDLDSLKTREGAVYIEEFTSGTITFRNGIRKNTRFEVTFVVFTDIDPNAEHREAIREERIDPAARALMVQLNRRYNITSFSHNSYPKGFDVSEVTKTIVFNLEEGFAC